MLVLSPLRYNTSAKDERDNNSDIIESFADFITDGNNLLETINFDDLFTGINDGYDVLPNLDMDSEIILAEFSVSSGDDESSDINNNTTPSSQDNNSSRKEQQGLNQSVSHKSSKSKVNNKACKKSSGQSNKPEGKRKVKVDWTPELHRRFVQAVEQLGIDKAVPSRILELMGIEGLTRHNIASHLQKYRSHRKHLLAREAEAASWSQRRQLYNAPTMGFPPPMPHFRPLHVWGHPSADQSLMHVWPKHPPPPPAWAPIVPPHPSPPPIPSFWHPHHQGAPSAHCFPAPIAPTTFPALPVQGMPPCAAMIKTALTGSGQDSPPCDFHPSKENIDAAIEDVLAKPNLLPLPLGLKPPSIDSVLNELQRQGISKIPPIVSGS